MNNKRFTLLFATALLLLAVVMTAVACDNGEVETPTSGDVTTPAPETDAPSVQDTTEEATTDGKVTYTVKVVDASGAPVAGVAVQFCDDNGCRMPVATNADGIVTLHEAESNFHVTIASVPEGFAADTNEYYFDGAVELTVTLNAQ